MYYEVKIVGTRENAMFRVNGKLSKDGSVLSVNKADAIRLALEMTYWHLNDDIGDSGFSLARFKVNGREVLIISPDVSGRFVNYVDCPAQLVGQVRHHFVGRRIPFEFKYNG